jgi:hypothetical protein
MTELMVKLVQYLYIVASKGSAGEDGLSKVKSQLDNIQLMDNTCLLIRPLNIAF